MKPSARYASFGAERSPQLRQILFVIILLFFAVPALQASSFLDREGEEAAPKSIRKKGFFQEIPCDTIYCINGKIYRGQLVSVNSEAVLFWKHRKKSSRLKVLQIEKVFSIGKAVGSEQILYRQDSGFYESGLSVEEMRFYMVGARDARRYYRSPMTTVGGFFVGAASAMVGFWATPIPFLYTLYVYGSSTNKAFKKMNQRHAYADVYTKAAGPPRKINRAIAKQLNLKNINRLCFKIDQEYMDDYIQGFEDEAGARKAFNAAKGTAVGYIGLAVASLIIFL